MVIFIGASVTIKINLWGQSISVSALGPRAMERISYKKTRGIYIE